MSSLAVSCDNGCLAIATMYKIDSMCYNYCIMTQAKYIRIYSDLHLDYDVGKSFAPQNLWLPRELATDRETILILAGDIWHAKKPLSYAGHSWLSELSCSFHSIILVLGNHDFWGGNIFYEYDRVKSFAKGLGNVYLLQNSEVVIEDIRFLGATLWTDFGQHKDVSFARSIMNDYKFIKYSPAYSRLRPEHILREHIVSRQYLEQQLSLKHAKSWVITHHAPTQRSVSAYEEHPHLDYSNLEYLFSNVDVWVHGHTHQVLDYYVDNTRILSNPRGYPHQKLPYHDNVYPI